MAIYSPVASCSPPDIRLFLQSSCCYTHSWVSLGLCFSTEGFQVSLPTRSVHSLPPSFSICLLTSLFQLFNSDAACSSPSLDLISLATYFFPLLHPTLAQPFSSLQTLHSIAVILQIFFNQVSRYIYILEIVITRPDTYCSLTISSYGERFSRSWRLVLFPISVQATMVSQHLKPSNVVDRSANIITFIQFNLYFSRTMRESNEFVQRCKFGIHWHLFTITETCDYGAFALQRELQLHAEKPTSK